MFNWLLPVTACCCAWCVLILLPCILQSLMEKENINAVRKLSISCILWWCYSILRGLELPIYHELLQQKTGGKNVWYNYYSCVLLNKLVIKKRASTHDKTTVEGESVNWSPVTFCFIGLGNSLGSAVLVNDNDSDTSLFTRGKISRKVLFFH